MSNTLKVIKEAIRLGYTVTKEGVFLNPKGKEPKGSTNQFGYKKVTMRILEYVGFPLYVHKFQAYLKYGDQVFKKGIEVRHKNAVASDNSWENILIGTHSDNMMDIPQEKRRKMASNPKHNHKQIIQDYDKGLSYKEIMDKHNITSKGTVSYIIRKSMAQE